MPEVSESMKRLVKEVRKHAIAPKAKTFFSIEGIIGHYENPTSELLCFFLSPNEEHGLGSLFLRAFFTCLGKDSSALNLTDADGCKREVRTRDFKLIDMIVSGSDWVLIIENKIGHWPANPFLSYEKHATRYYPGKNQYFAILSPAGKPELKWPNWEPVSYQNFCDALKVEFAKTGFQHPDSKWQIFAKELILHLENELYDPAMTLTTEQRNFVESNLENISHLKQLFDCYTAELRNELTARLQQEIPSRPFRFYDRPWDIACDENFAGVVSRFCFYTPFHKTEIRSGSIKSLLGSNAYPNHNESGQPTYR